MTARARDPVSSARRLPSEMHRFHAAVRVGKRNAEGHYALAYGLRLGYWPCLKAPYIQVAFHRWRIEVWLGLPSYLRGAA
jgi:hypothetical protein